MHDQQHVGASVAASTNNCGSVSPASSNSATAPAESQPSAEGVPPNDGRGARSAEADAYAAQILSHWSEGGATKPLGVQWNTSDLGEREGVGDVTSPRSNQLQRQRAAGNGNPQAETVRGSSSSSGRPSPEPGAEASIYRQKSAGGESANPEHPAVDESLRRTGQGAPLAESLRREMEITLGADFRHVRIHTDSLAAEAASAVHARAFTVGQDIFFAQGSFEPGSLSGKQLLAHELTHVVQSQQGRVQNAEGHGRTVSQPGHSLETEAEAAASRIGTSVSSHEPGAGKDKEQTAQRQSQLASPIGPMASDGSLGGHEVAEKSVHIGNAAAVIQRAPGDPTETQATSTGRIAFVREDNLNLRIGPGQQTKSLMQLRFGQRVHLLDSSDQAGWRKVAVLGQTGYVYAHGQRIHFPDESLINKDPGLSLIKVKSNQSFWGLVKEVYGIQGNETTADQNINHFINAIKAINKPSAFKVKAGLLDKVGNAFVSGRDASDTELIENVDLWIPSYHVAAKMDVGSGTVTGEVSRFVKKIDQKLADFSAACGAAKKFIPGAIGRNASAMAEGLLTGLIDFALDAAKILATSTAVGALIGALFGGVGAIPGAEIGFEIGLFILNCYGIYMLVEAVLGVAGSLLSQLGKFISLAWNANGDKEQIEAAGKALAEALGVLVSAVLMALAAYVLKKGSEALLKTKFAKTVGESRLAQWLKKRQKMTTTKEQIEKANQPKAVERSTLHEENSKKQEEDHSKQQQEAKNGEGQKGTVNFDSSQLQHEYKHAQDFGINGNMNKINLDAFKAKLQAHIDAHGPGISGTYRKGPAIHYLDRSTGLNVFTRPDGTFWGAWKLTPGQLAHWPHIGGGK